MMLENPSSSNKLLSSYQRAFNIEEVGNVLGL